MKKYVFYLLSITTLMFLISGCSTVNKGKMLKNGTQNNASAASENGIKYPSVNNTENSQLSQADRLGKNIASLKKSIHFKFNSSNLDVVNEYGISENPVDILSKIADIMINNPSIKIRIEGNCDERGTEEYNLALGQKRAISAKRYLETKGVDPKKIDTVSYGESQPADPDHNEEAWAKNRRDHFAFIK